MYIIDCLPFSKSLDREILSYFSSERLESGSLIKVSLRNKIVFALVLESRSVGEAKSEIKAASFQLKKISSPVAKPFLQKEFVEAVKITAEYFATTQGGVLSQLIPSFLLENPGLLYKQTEKSAETKTGGEISVLQATDEERFVYYRSLIREEFAKKNSVFLCLPQNEDVRRAKEKLGRGIEQFVFSFHGEMPTKELRKEWKKIQESDHPVLIIGTARWLLLPRNDLGVIVLDQENRSGWKTLARPFLDLRFFAETLARNKKIRLIIGDLLLRVETAHRYKKGELSEFENVKWRLPAEATATVVDLKKSIKKEKEFKTLSPELLALIKATIEKGSHIFIFAARKGLAPVTICRDCGEIVRCFNCESPVVLYRTKTGGAFRCHQCGETRDAAEVCQNCHSWKLAAYGSGIDRVAEEIRANFPDIKLFEIHRDIASTSAKALNIVEEFYETRGAVLLGTELAFSYLYKKMANAAIVSFDSLFSIPDFRIREKIFNIILQTRDLAKKAFLIQSRNSEDPTIELAVTGNLAEFHKREVEDRRLLNYPPFGTFIKVVVRGTKNFTAKESGNLKNILKGYSPTIFPSVHEKRGEQSAINAVIKVDWGAWPDSKLVKILKSLPPHFEIKVDPDNLL